MPLKSLISLFSSPLSVCLGKERDGEKTKDFSYQKNHFMKESAFCIFLAYVVFA